MNRVVVEVEAAAEGMLVLTDLYYPGWSAEVNGEKRKILRVDGLVRGVFVDKGASLVEFTYLPRSFLAGLGLSLASILGLVYCGSRSRRRSLARRG
jgi:uncharacterized membrane protein YfhO